MPHTKTSEWARDSDEEDRVEQAIRASGCWDHHIACVDCMGEKADWRKCQDPLDAFKKCMTAYHTKKRQEEKVLKTVDYQPKNSTN